MFVVDSFLCRPRSRDRLILENTLASKTAEHSITMKKNISAFLLGWSKAMEQSSRLQNPSPSTFFLTETFAQDFPQKKKTSLAITNQHQQGNKRFFSATSAQASASWQNDSKFKSQRKGQQKKAKTSDSEFDIFS